MRNAAALACLLSASASCGGGSSKYASAAATAGIAVAAAAVYRETTGGCWAMCPQGERCDEASGACVPLPCRGACPAEHRCVMVDGGETCVRSPGRDVATGPPEDDAAQRDAGAPSTSAAPSDPCRGLCLRSERCVVTAGVADCAPVADAGAP